MLPPLRPAASLDAFAASPGGSYLAGERTVVWSATSELMGAAAWDEPSPADVDFLVIAWDAMAREHRDAFDKVLDFRRVQRVTESAFARLIAHARARGQQRSKLRRQVVAVSPDIVAALAHGFWHLVPARGDLRIVEDLAEGLAWLGVPADRVAFIDRVVDEARDASVLARLRTWLRHHLEEPSIAHAAAALGVGTRTLQRHLRLARTTFREEVHAVRFAVAREFLAARDAKVEAVSLQVGYRSVSSFVRSFRVRFGVTPSAWRDQPP